MKKSSIVLVVTGSIASLFAVGLLAIGALAFVGDSEKDSDGYLSTDTHQFEAGTRALATENLDVDLDAGDCVLDTKDLGKVRLQVESRDDKPVFVGIARTSDVENYLAGRLAHDAHGRRHLAVRGATTTTTPAIAARSRPADSQHLGRIRARLGQADPELGDRGRRLLGRGDERRRLRRSRRRRQRRRQHPVPRRDRMERARQRRDSCC